MSSLSAIRAFNQAAVDKFKADASAAKRDKAFRVAKSFAAARGIGKIGG